MNNKFVGWVVVFLIFFLNLFDGFSTFFILSTGDFIELNPIIKILIDYMGIWFLIPKTLIGFMASLFIIIGWEKYKLAQIGGFTILSVYWCLTIYHFYNIFIR